MCNVWDVDVKMDDNFTFQFYCKKCKRFCYGDIVEFTERKCEPNKMRKINGDETVGLTPH
jgi:methionyl-tRNA synthetase